MNKLNISPSPHVHGGFSTRRLMGDVLIALLPAFAVSMWIWGLGALVTTAVSVASCMFFEWTISKYFLKTKPTTGDLSAVVTGVLLAFNLPSTLPLWMTVVGALVAIGVGKMSFGGLGKNPFNPALVGRVFLLLSFPVAMTSFPGIDGVTGATPLAVLKSGGDWSSIDHVRLLLGTHAGSLGEMSAAALLLGFVYLLCRKVIRWTVPVIVLATMALFTGILHIVDPVIYADPLFHLLTGGAILGAVFMATDYSSSPMSCTGGIIYAIGIGVITVLIRVWGAYPEGMSFAILIMNAVVPLLNKGFKPKLFGGGKKR